MLSLWFVGQLESQVREQVKYFIDNPHGQANSKACFASVMCLLPHFAKGTPGWDIYLDQESAGQLQRPKQLTWQEARGNEASSRKELKQVHSPLLASSSAISAWCPVLELRCPCYIQKW
jgi:hypothetical protein